jgi:hypothetical protein
MLDNALSSILIKKINSQFSRVGLAPTEEGNNEKQDHVER